jgi:hypothetical protein
LILNISSRYNPRGQSLEILATTVELNDIVDSCLAIVEPNEVLNVDNTVYEGLSITSGSGRGTQGRHEE